MTEEARAIVEALRHLGKPVDFALTVCSSCPMQDYPHTMAVECGENCPGVLMLMAADLIEVVIAKLETTTQERDAAIADLKEADIVSCEHCRHQKTCPVPCEEVDIDCSVCPADCMCKTCRDNSNWEWRGVKEE